MKLKEDTRVSIDVKEAVRLAKDFAANLLEAEKVSRLGLEAVERSEDGRYWLVTLGFSRPWDYPKYRRRPRTALDDILPSADSEPDREYKVFKVDAESGEVVGMQVFESKE